MRVGNHQIDPAQHSARELAPEGWPDLVAYLTDGDGTFPERPPPYPVVWLLPEKSPVVPPFGMRIEIPPR